MTDLPEKLPVVVVGGGEIGLASSILLSLQGIQHVLFERHETCAIVPKAIGLHNRTMELFRTMGIDDEVYRLAAPPETYRRTAWYTSLGPHGREIASREGFGYCLSKTDRGRAYANASPSRYANFAQLRLEPLLRKRAEELNPGRILFHHEVTSAREHSDAATITFHARSGALEHRSRNIKAVYVVGADGGRLLMEQLGMHWEGESDIADMVTAHIRAPLSTLVPDPSVLLHWFVNPYLGGSTKSGILYHLGPYPRDPKTEEWSFLAGRLPHETHKPFTETDMLSRIRKVLQTPGLEIELLSMSHWFLQAKTASSYISPGGKVFLVGDAAKKAPPWGALGGNTGFGDIGNLVWKLAWALKSSRPEDFDGLLRSYDVERRPVGQRVAKTGLANMRAHGDILDRALGITAGNSVEENVAAVDLYFDAIDSASGAARREAVRKAAHETMDIEFFALGAEAGWFYDFSDIFDEKDDAWRSPQVRGDGSVEICEYHPCTVPGHQLPHAWVTNASNERMSTRHLVKRDRFLLLTESSCWKAVQHDMLDLVILNEEGGWQDADGKWAAQREVSPSGAVLVRPDNIVAWRWKDGRMLKDEADPTRRMDEVLRTVLRVQAPGH